MRKKTVFAGLALALAVGAAGCGAQEEQGQESDGQESGMAEEELEEARARIREIYDVDSQSAVREELDAEKGEKQYTADDMLVEYDPFGTNTQSLYVYFQTETPVSVSCTVHVEDEDIPDYTQQLTEDSSYLLEHEYQVIGLVPDMENEITFTLAETDGQTEEQTIIYEMGSLLGQEAVQLETEEGDSGEEQEEGLYVVLGNDSDGLDFMYYYDNSGVLRGEVPIIGYRSHRLLFSEEGMYFSISETEMARMDELGQVTAVYDLGQYELHHDYVFDDDGNILLLATDTEQDSVEDESLPEGQYYLYMFNNNIGVSETRPDFDWRVIDGIQSEAVDGTTSYYYKYLVDETAGSYELVESFELPYSGYVSSVQEIGDNVVADSGMQGIWGEYDSENDLIRSFTMERKALFTEYTNTNCNPYYLQQ